jgi:hypothetical protein
VDNNVKFTSTLFRPVLPEESQVNPGRYGAELAYWLCAELAKIGVFTSYPNYEDWGWFVEYTTPDGDEFWLCCGNVDGGDDEWQCYLRPLGRKLFGRDKAPIEEAKPLMEGLRQALENTRGIENIEWWYEE